MKISIEKKEFVNFMRKYKSGEFKEQRLGQGFYNHFELHKMTSNTNRDKLNKLYFCNDEKVAINLINEIFDTDM